jgi:hypothetical protein
MRAVPRLMGPQPEGETVEERPSAPDSTTRETGSPQIQLDYDPFGRLVVSLPGGERVVGVVPVRCFPFSAPAEHISLCDEHGREVYCLAHLDALPAETRARLEQDLSRRELLPLIQRIRSVSPGAEPTTWHVDTDRGETCFTLPSEDNIRRLATHGALIADSHGVRYRILDSRRLDPHSRKILSQYL